VLARRRQDLIAEEVRRQGAVRVSELVSLLGVSDMTIRRDLDVLAGAGLLEKVHGGATVLSESAASTDEPGFEAKSHQQTAEKLAIAELAAELVRPGTAIGITAGTTTWHLADMLGEIADLVVVTNSIRVADRLHAAAEVERTVILTGGVRTPSDALVGPVAERALASLHLDQVFMGVHGMTERAGFTTPNLMESETNCAFVNAAEHLVVLADHTKWGTLGLSTIARLHEADVLVSDDGLPADAQQVLRSEVGELFLAHPGRSSSAPPAEPSLGTRQRSVPARPIPTRSSRKR
jgi:DeoR/GlpR family transcriptional regulator of sugar metabolism